MAPVIQSSHRHAVGSPWTWPIRRFHLGQVRDQLSSPSILSFTSMAQPLRIEGMASTTCGYLSILRCLIDTPHCHVCFIPRLCKISLPFPICKDFSCGFMLSTSSSLRCPRLRLLQWRFLTWRTAHSQHVISSSLGTNIAHLWQRILLLQSSLPCLYQPL